MLWLPDFAEIHGREWENWPDWPKDRAGTVRNFARWLEMGLVSRDR
ncbi:hypothetical protein [Sphingopyxis sp. PET50]|nr:hypothetical protein [Sphingopyxis sp. PET50]